MMFWGIIWMAPVTSRALYLHNKSVSDAKWEQLLETEPVQNYYIDLDGVNSDGVVTTACNMINIPDSSGDYKGQMDRLICGGDILKGRYSYADSNDIEGIALDSRIADGGLRLSCNQNNHGDFSCNIGYSFDIDDWRRGINYDKLKNDGISQEIELRLWNNKVNDYIATRSILVHYTFSDKDIELLQQHEAQRINNPPA